MRKPTLEDKVEFVDYGKIPYLETSLEILDNPVVIFEKLDGSNVQVRKYGEKVLLGTRSNFLNEKNIRAIWMWDFLRWGRKYKDILSRIPDNVIIFGEWVANQHVLDYDWDKINKFYFIDIAYVGSNGKLIFYDYSEAKDYLSFWGMNEIMEILSPIAKGKFSFDEIKKLANQRSQLVKREKNLLYDGKMEGVVIKDYINQRFVKYLNPEFSEIRIEENKAHRYLNENRFRKVAAKIFEKYGKVVLNDLIAALRSDIYEETGECISIGAILGEIRINDWHKKYEKKYNIQRWYNPQI